MKTRLTDDITKKVRNGIALKDANYKNNQKNSKMVSKEQIIHHATMIDSLVIDMKPSLTAYFMTNFTKSMLKQYFANVRE